jgi:signal transduction histidine kinase
MGALPVFVSGLCLLMVAAWAVERRRAADCARALTAARAAHQDAVRLLRLTAGDLRAPALALKSHAEQGDTALLALSRRLLDLAEWLLDQTEQPDAPRQLTDETLQVAPLLDFVVAQVSGQLGPGQRAWHIAGDLAGVVLRADRRAVHQVLLRVVSAAALATRDKDWIDIHADTRDQGWALVVEDEGTGLPVEQLSTKGTESRGLGVGLALARSLMLAHGGSLTIESAPQVGTRAVIQFPRERLVAV